MSIMPMYRKCPNCRRSFGYNPSVGDFGILCPHCCKPIIVSGVSECINTVKKI